MLPPLSLYLLFTLLLIKLLLDDACQMCHKNKICWFHQLKTSNNLLFKTVVLALCPESSKILLNCTQPSLTFPLFSAEFEFQTMSEYFVVVIIHRHFPVLVHASYILISANFIFFAKFFCKFQSK